MSSEHEDPQGEQSYEESLERGKASGLYPRHPQLGRIYVVGTYTLPFFDETRLIEIIINRPYWTIDFHEWHPYQAPGTDDEWHVGLADFYFNEAGDELIGSFLKPPPVHRTTRVGLLLRDLYSESLFYEGSVVKATRYGPIPDRLLRLIWIEEGAPFQGPLQVLMEDA